MFGLTKILRGSLSGSTLGVEYPREVYLSLCTKYSEPRADGSRHSNSFIADESYSAMLSRMEVMHRGSHDSDTGTSFLLDGLWSEVEGHKYVIHVRDAYYHLVINTLATILKIYEDDPDAIFIIVTGSVDSSDGDQGRNFNKAAEFISAILSRNDIPFWFLKTYYELPSYLELNSLSKLRPGSGGPRLYPGVGAHPIFKLKNVTIVDDYNNPMGLTLRDLTLLIDKYVLTKINRGQGVSESLVYISRGSTNEADSAFVGSLEVGSGYVDNCRLYSEPLLEQYLESKGFLIMREEDFDSIESQIAFISSAKLIVGATGTGLINAFFMHPNKTVIELKVEIATQGYDSILISDYMNFSYAKGHRYIGLDVFDKQGATAIRALSDLFEALDLDKI